MTKLIVGCGYLGLRVARRWIAAGHEVVGVVRRKARAAELAAIGIRPLVADVTRPETLVRLPAAETVLYCVGYDPAGTKTRWEVYVEGLRNFLHATSSSVEAISNRPYGRLIFVSSTGVFGATDGAWVDEDSPCHPNRDAGRAFVAAEQLLAEHPLGARSIVLRLAGLYGPGRVLHSLDIAQKAPLMTSAEAHLNLIHVEDAAAVVLAAESRAAPPRTYLVSDGHPATRREYYHCLADLLERPRPQFVEGGASSGKERSHGSKRVRNSRMLCELGVQLSHPTYREGLIASLGEAGAPAGLRL
jgi:nucleoside-diphosphate-sugar epimerase